MGSLKSFFYGGILLIFIFSLTSISFLILKINHAIPIAIAKNANIYSLIVSAIIFIICICLKIDSGKWPWQFDKKDWQLLRISLKRER